MKHNLPLGVTLSLFAALLYSTQTALIKAQAPFLPSLPVVIFVQSLVSLLLILPIIFKNGLSSAKLTLTTKKLPIHLLRTLFSLAISFLLFTAVTYIPLVNALLLANTAPLIVPFIAYVVLGQQINHSLWVPILIGFIGVAIVLHPDARIFNPAALLALGAAVGMGSTMLTVRKLAATESTLTTAFYFFLFSTIISGMLALAFWQPINLRMTLIMSTIGILYFACQYASTAALKYINPQLMGSLFYSNILYATVLSALIWNTVPTTYTFIGMILITVGGILCIRVEHLFHKRKTNLVISELQYAKESR